MENLAFVPREVVEKCLPKDVILTGGGKLARNGQCIGHLPLDVTGNLKINLYRPVAPQINIFEEAPDTQGIRKLVTDAIAAAIDSQDTQSSQEIIRLGSLKKKAPGAEASVERTLMAYAKAIRNRVAAAVLSVV